MDRGKKRRNKKPKTKNEQENIESEYVLKTSLKDTISQQAKQTKGQQQQKGSSNFSSTNVQENDTRNIQAKKQQILKEDKNEPKTVIEVKQRTFGNGQGMRK